MLLSNVVTIRVQLGILKYILMRINELLRIVGCGAAFLFEVKAHHNTLVV